MLSSLGGELSSGRIYTATPDNSLIVPELKNLEYGDRQKGAEVNKHLLWKRKRTHDNFPPMSTNNSQYQLRRLDWLQEMKREGEFFKCCCCSCFE